MDEVKSIPVKDEPFPSEEDFAFGSTRKSKG
jgi:hypothetical protein